MKTAFILSALKRIRADVATIEAELAGLPTAKRQAAGPIRIKATNDAGEIVHVFTSLRDAARAGFSLSRLHKALHNGQRHRGLKWSRIDGLNGLADWLRSHTTDEGMTDAAVLHHAFLAELPPNERNIDLDEFWRRANGLHGQECVYPLLPFTLTCELSAHP